MHQILIVLSVVILVSCSEARSYDKESLVDSTGGFEVTEGTDYTIPAGDFVAVQTGDLNNEPVRSTEQRKLIRNSSMHCQVGSLDSARTQIQALLKGYQGYVSSEKVNSNYRDNLTYNLRIPEAKFDKFLLAVEAISTEVLSRSVNVKDVTDQYVDIAARLSTKRALHTRYTQLLSKAKNVKEVIEVERELAKVLADIESSEARLKSLEDRTVYATLQLSFSTEGEAIAQANFLNDLGESLSAGWTGVKMAVLLGATLWPLLLFGVLLFFGIRWMTTRRKTQRIVA